MANMGEIGKSGLLEWSGVIQEDYLRELRGKQAFIRYNEMRLSSPVVGAMLLATELAIRGIDWNYASNRGEEDKRVIFLHEARDGMSHSWNDHIIEALTMLPFGWSYFEIVYQRDESGRITWRKFAPRGQDTLDHWAFDDSGGLAGMYQRIPPTYKPILLPIEKCILYRTRTEKNNPEGRSILRSAWIPYYYQKNISQIEAIGIERDLAGLPHIKLPEGADTGETGDTDYTKAAKLVRRIRNDEAAGIVTPAGWEFELVSTGGTRQFDTDKIIGRYDSRILMSTLAQFLILGQDRVGTQALSSDMTDFFTTAVNATADIIAETHTKYAAARLLTLNGMDPDGITLEHSPAGDIDLPALADFLQKVGAMITWTPQDEAWLRSAARLPELAPEEIEAERERKREEQMEMFKLRQPFNQQPGDGREEDGRPPRSSSPDRNTAELYVSDRAPDDDERRTWERRMERIVKGYWASELKRVVKGAKEVRRRA